MLNRPVVVALTAVFTAAALAACASAPKPATAPPPVPAPAPPLKSGLDLAGFDRSVRPQDDLYRFAGGTWLAKTPIPADRSNYGSFIILDDQAQEEVRQLIVAASTQANRPTAPTRRRSATSTSPTWIPRAWRASGSRRSATNWRASTPSPRRAMWRATSAIRSASGVAQPFAWFSSPDNKNSTVYLGALYQNGLTMPDRDYYLSPDEKYATFRAKFAEYVEQMLARAGERNAQSAAARIAALETRIANYQWTKVQNRDPVKTYNPHDAARIPEAGAGFRLAGVLRRHGRARAAARRQPAPVHQGHRPAGEDGAGVRLARLFQIPAAR